MSALLSFFDEQIFPHLQRLPAHFSLSGSLLAMFAVVYLSKYLQAFLSLLLEGKYDNVQASFRYNNSSGSATQGKGEGGRQWAKRTVQRAYSAHQNHWEAFVGFAVAILLALVNRDEPHVQAHESELIQLANAFLYVRVAFNLVYVVAFNTPLSLVRSSVWMIGALIVVKIFLIAIGNPFLTIA